MKRAAIVLLAFFAITLALAWLWTNGGREAYGRFLLAVGQPIFDAIGADVPIRPMRERYINWIPFVGLVLVTPGIAFARRFLGLFLGLVFLSACHIGLNLLTSDPRGRHLPLVPSMLSDALPFVVWFLVAWPVVASWFQRALESGVQADPEEEAGATTADVD